MMRLLIANRGEIARRIHRTATRLGFETVAIFAEPDRDAPFVQDATWRQPIGPASLADSYLNIDKVLGAARDSGATAVHPGYGFLSENADFARAVEAAGLVWVGPHPEAIEKMGSKIEARALAEAAGVPLIPGYSDSQQSGDLASAAEEIGFPVLIKAAAGGGGKGIRIVHEPEAFAAALDEAMMEADRNFGDAKMIVERFIERARHVEVQIVGDRFGSVVDLGTRECSIQRRYQKLLEEAPAPNLSEATETGLRDSARRLATAIGYDSAGTVEFVVDDATGDFFFLEMNTRLQVEHPVTEEITGLDLVELQLGCAEGKPLPVDQSDISFRGHAFEARINAEDAQNDFAPQIGRLCALAVPPFVRFESGVECGSEISPHYDSMVAKLITTGADRGQARRRLAKALDELIIGGLVTNTGFHRWLIEQPDVVEGRMTTRFLDNHPFEISVDEAAARGHRAATQAASAWRSARRTRRAGGGAWQALGSFRMVPHASSHPLMLAGLRGDQYAIENDPAANATKGNAPSSVVGGALSGQASASVVDLAAKWVCVNDEGETHTFAVCSRSDVWAPAAGAGGAGDSEAVRAPFPAVVTETPVSEGQAVAAGDVVVVIEAMKMLHSLSARGPGIVASVAVAVGDSVDSNQVLVSFVEDEESD